MTKHTNSVAVASVRCSTMPATAAGLYHRCQAWLRQLPPQLDLPFILQATALLLLADLPPGQLSHTLRSQADVLLPSALVFLLLLFSGNSELTRQHGRLASFMSALVMTALLLLSFILSYTMLFPDMAGSHVGSMLISVSIGSLIIAILSNLRSTHVQLRQPVAASARQAPKHHPAWLRWLRGYLRLVLLLVACKLLLGLL
ncbi:hypothetical protein [Aquitalea aquatica]|uniref:Uncharacterized protein n=1 Tax=Aquitalea aquatica TaxID=3044273 RepID=A0A838Y5U6_9NEIS|nr:hypothetical protein [Aquitalea magnusonii]MBA4708732.1 hypothetical protein [Aquitalea magnusonii]